MSYILWGDNHGDYSALMRSIKKGLFTDRVIIQAGDFGIGFDPMRKNFMNQLIHLNAFLEKYDFFLYVIRGNHDNPACFTGDIKLSNLHLLKDYSVINIGEENILCVGGAISIDRKVRTLDVDYFSDEGFVFDEKIITGLRDITTVVTHTAPSFCPPIGMGSIVHHYIQTDVELYYDLIKERELVDKFHNLLKVNNDVKYWYYGHFHSSDTFYHEGISFRLLDINEFFQHY